MRFLKDSDYEQGPLIKTEILKLLSGATPNNLGANYKLITAEQMAVSQARKWLANRFDCNAVFSASQNPDERDSFMVMLIIDLTLYHLYSQTASKDMPEHRSTRYEDALTFLKDAGRGLISTDLPTSLSETNEGETRMWSKGVDNDDW